MYINTGLIESLTYEQLEERLEEVNDALGQVALIRKYAYDEPYTSREEQEERLKFLDNGEAELDRLHEVYSNEIERREEDASLKNQCPVHHKKLVEEWQCEEQNYSTSYCPECP